MNQPWLLTGLLLVSAPALYFVLRFCRRFSTRLDDERAQARKMAELHLATIEALALAIDAKDQTAPNHIRRVQTYATGVARALGMTEHEVHGIRTAALSSSRAEYRQEPNPSFASYGPQNRRQFLALYREHGGRPG